MLDLSVQFALQSSIKEHRKNRIGDDNRLDDNRLNKSKAADEGLFALNRERALKKGSFLLNELKAADEGLFALKRERERGLKKGTFLLNELKAADERLLY